MAEDRTVRTEYEYYDMDDNPYYVHYNGFLKSTKIDDPGNNHFSRVTYKYNEFLTAYPEFEAKKLLITAKLMIIVHTRDITDSDHSKQNMKCQKKDM